MVVDIQARALRLVAADGGTIGDADTLQGTWTVEQYLRLTEYSSRLIEYVDGTIEVLPVPTKRHQAILGLLYRILYTFMQGLGGAVYLAPLSLLIHEGKFREPDLMVALDADDPRLQNNYWLGADLVVEIVSPSSRELDTVVKRAEYAESGIPEYWIVDSQDEVITVLRLEGGEYVEHGVFRRGDRATSVLLEGFGVDVSEVLDAQ
jgi:Uma2 family endonuclease